MDSVRFLSFQFFQEKLTLLLFSAAEHGYTHSVSALLAAGANPNTRNQQGYTALMLAARYGHTPIVDALISAGADVNAVMLPPAAPEVTYRTLTQRVENLLPIEAGEAMSLNEEGYTALMIAVSHGHEAVVTRLLSNQQVRENINRAARNNPRQTALGIAIENDHPSIRQILLRHGAILPAFYQQELRTEALNAFRLRYPHYRAYPQHNILNRPMRQSTNTDISLRCRRS
jgi:ankyrin repeat protein